MTAAESSRKLIYLQMEVRRMYVVSFSLILVPVALCYTEGNALQGIGRSVLHEELISRLWTGAVPADKPCTHIESSFTRNWTICCRKKKKGRKVSNFLGLGSGSANRIQCFASAIWCLRSAFTLWLLSPKFGWLALLSERIKLPFHQSYMTRNTDSFPHRKYLFPSIFPPKKNSDKFSLTSLFLLQFALGIGIARRSKIFWFLHRSSIPLELT